MAEAMMVQNRGYQGRTTRDAMELALEMSHVRNFLDCMRSRRRPAADVEEGHLSATLCHIANISTRLGRSLRWDPEREIFADDSEASRMLSRPYRTPWRLPAVVDV